jgi:ParB/RepB/Spo0J family partition protein
MIEGQYQHVSLDLVDPPAVAMREAMDPDKLDELVSDVRARGVRLPLELVERGTRYEIIAGHRRYVAATRAGRVTVPAIVFPPDYADVESDRYLENELHEPVNPADEAMYLNYLLEKRCKGDTDRLAAFVRKPRAYVEGRLLLLQGDAAIFEALKACKIGVGIAQQLNRCTEDKWRRFLLHQAVTGGATVAIVSGWVDEWKRRTVALGGPALPEVSESTSAAAISIAPFTCHVCHGTEHPHAMEHIVVHQYCKLAVLDKLLNTYRGDEPVSPATSDPRR